MTQAELPTTDGELAVRNLEASLQGAEGLFAANPADAASSGRLITYLCARGQYLGRIADYERAQRLAEQVVKAAPQDAWSYVLRAQTRSIFHDFEGAQADLDQAVKLRGGNRELRLIVEQRRISILTALGKLDEALAQSRKLAQANPDLTNLGAEANLLASQGDTAQAEALFIEAQKHFPDVSPFPVAWLYFQEGLMWESAGDLQRAHELYAAAHERLPAYAPAVAHLATVEAAQAQREHAIALLRTLVNAADDPEYSGQLAALLADSGQSAQAEPLRASARTRYQELLARYPRAFASHAARFYLSAGGEGDLQAAAQWAERNLKERPTPEAYSLAVEVLAKTGPKERACALADEMEKLPYKTSRMHVMAARAFLSCGERERADALLSIAGK
jgi:tetratricopeptide (TPR) repeat protein